MVANGDVECDIWLWFSRRLRATTQRNVLQQPLHLFTLSLLNFIRLSAAGGLSVRLAVDPGGAGGGRAEVEARGSGGDDSTKRVAGLPDLVL